MSVYDPNKFDVPKVDAGQVQVHTILVLVWGIAGAIAVLVITIAGIEYILSQGDPAKTAKAKNTILYAVIGLVIVMLSYAIINFVLTNFIK